MRDPGAALPLLALACAGPGDDTGSPPLVLDPAAQYVAGENPSGPWGWGYTVGLDRVVGDVRLDAHTETTGPMTFWHPDATPDGYYPYVAFNAGDAAASNGSWALRPEQVALEAASDGRYAVVILAAPPPGTYAVEVAFEGVHFGLSTTSVFVMRGDDTLFEATIDGYGGDPSFHEITGASPRATWDGTVVLPGDEPLWFAVGVGANGTHYADTTALAARVERLGMPW